MNKNLLITFSGGRTSAFMARFIHEHKKYNHWNKLFVFANTGKEEPETLDFIQRCSVEWSMDIIWVEAYINQIKGIGTDYKIVDYDNCSKNGEPFYQLVEKYGLPSKLWRHCTRELKEKPIHQLAKEIFKGEYYTAMGIRADEGHRIGSKKNYIYPLFDMGITEKLIRNWWDKQPFDLQLKDYEGNCDLCFLKSVRKKLTILKNNPLKANWWENVEDKFSNETQPIFDVYRNLSIKDLVEKSKLTFKTVEDKHELSKRQKSLFDFEMDLEFDCFCKAN